MGKYLVLWEIDQTKIPVDPKERKDTWSLFMAVVRQDIEKGIVTDWGGFIGETKGYSINEGRSDEHPPTVCTILYLHSTPYRFREPSERDDKSFIWVIN